MEKECASAYWLCNDPAFSPLYWLTGAFNLEVSCHARLVVHHYKRLKVDDYRMVAAGILTDI